MYTMYLYWFGVVAFQVAIEYVAKIPLFIVQHQRTFYKKARRRATTMTYVSLTVQRLTTKLSATLTETTLLWLRTPVMCKRGYDFGIGSEPQCGRFHTSTEPHDGSSGCKLRPSLW